MEARLKKKIVVAGGAGHVGLPLSLVLAKANPQSEITIYDINKTALETIQSGKMPFKEEGAEPILKDVLGKNLNITSDKAVFKKADIVITVIGTPVDGHLNPQYSVVYDFFDEIQSVLRKDVVLILRSTLYPGTSEKVQQHLVGLGFEGHLAYCPERIAEGNAIKELREFPQIISGLTPTALQGAREIFGSIASELVELTPNEAELSKLFTNSWRYIQFATANQFYMLASAHGLDFYKIFHAITHKYPRTIGFPKAGFAAGPCLLKDTMQLSAFAQNQFFLGHGAMLVNEGLPDFIVSGIKKDYPNLDQMKVGILGMAFKAESDDKRDSLSYKLRRILNLHAKKVLCSDEYIKEPSFLSAKEILLSADLLIVGAPHRAYVSLIKQTRKPVYDIWDLTPKKSNELSSELEESVSWTKKELALGQI